MRVFKEERGIAAVGDWRVTNESWMMNEDVKKRREKADVALYLWP